ncbi:MAG: protein nirF [Alphaproteobacteria bacterium]|nr:protein nirF [Alphaproteobacteria bacterium]
MTRRIDRRSALKFGLAGLGAAMAVPVAARAEARPTPRATGDLGLIIERAVGRVRIVETTGRTVLHTIEGLGDLSHASAVFSRDERFAYVFGRDGGLTQVDMLEGRIVNRVVQGGNSIGGAISQDGRLVAVSNYKPGGVKIFDADTLALVADIPAAYEGSTEQSKTVGLVDAPEQKFVFSLYDAGETWLVDMSDPAKPAVTKFKGIGKLPYDGLITGDGRHYVAGLFGEDGLAMLDLWAPENGVKRILGGYGKGDKPLPVYKMPHLEGWAEADGKLFLPAVGRHEILAVERGSWREVGRVKAHSQPVFVMARPDGRHLWVNYAHPDNDTIEVIDVKTLSVVKTLKPGPAVLHMEFTPRGEHVWVSVRDLDMVLVYDTRTFEVLARLPMDKPSGIFFTARAHRTGL